MKSIVFAATLSVMSSPIFAQDMTVDGSSHDSYERSLKAMAEGMSDEDREAFARGLINMILTDYPPAAGAKGFAALQFMEPATEAAHITLDGVSRQEILDRGQEILAADTTSDLATTEDEDADVVLACLQSRVLLTDPKIERGSYGHNITMQVTNNLPWAIAGIRTEYVATSEGRSVPWHKDDISLSISGGIEPGETRELRTSASLFPSQAPDELITTMTVVDVSDPLERQLIRDVTVIGWADEKSPLLCE